MSAPTQLSEDDAKKDYLALCLKMTHAQLYAELMRVHKEATLLIQQAVEQSKREWVGLTRRELDIATLGLEDLSDCYKAIEAKLKEKNCGNRT